MAPPGRGRPRVFGFPAVRIAYVESLYEALKRRDVEVLNGDWSGRWLFRNVARGDTLHLHWPSFYYYDPRSSRGTLVGLLRFATLAWLMKVRGARIVWTAHNLYPHDGGKAIWAHRAARRLVARLADEIFVHGAQAASLVSREFGVPPSKLTIIPHGHWIGKYPNVVDRSAARSALGIGARPYVFAFIGLCKPYKGLEQLLEAMSELDRGDFFLLIAGKFQSESYHDAIVSSSAAVGKERVALHAGFVEDDRIQVFMNAADAVVLPYREILTSGAAMLAMSFGRPVVAPRMGALIDFVDEACGVLYDPTRASALTDAMRAARTRNFRSEEILRRVSRFTWDDAARPLDRR